MKFLSEPCDNKNVMIKMVIKIIIAMRITEIIITTTVIATTQSFKTIMKMKSLITVTAKMNTSNEKKSIKMQVVPAIK